MKRSRSSARRPADDSQDCSAGQRAYYTPRTTAERRDNYCTIPNKGSDPCALIDSHLQTTCKEE